MKTHFMIMIVVITAYAMLLATLITDLQSLQNEVEQQSQQLQLLEAKVESKQVLKPVAVTVTAYSPREAETDSTPFQTAFLSEVKPGTIAVSRDLFMAGWTPGKKVYIYQIGVFEIADLMSHRKKSHLDIFFFSTEQALEFGVKKSKAILLEI